MPLDGVAVDAAEHAVPPTSRRTLVSLGLLLAALVAVVGLAEVESPAIGSGWRPSGSRRRRSAS